MALSSLKEPLGAYRSLGEPVNARPIEIGLINKTYLITTDKLQFIFQELSPLFDPAVNFDSDAISKHLAHSSIITPKIYKSDFDELYYVHQGRCYRALFYIEGQSFNICQKEMASSAALVIGKFHQALLTLDYTYRSTRKSAGDYPFHQENLVQALKKFPEHAYFAQVSPLASKMIDNMSKLKIDPPKILRHIHGDPKISNLIFEGHQAICLVDFDTLQKSSWSLELADAFRSWCNPYPEDNQQAFADLKIAELALEGYSSVMKGHFTLKDAEDLATHCQAISLCLAMRYLADTLTENYFNFDSKRFATRADHNWQRAQAMYKLYLDFHQKRAELLGMIKDLML